VVKLDGSPDKIIRIPHTRESFQELEARGLVPVTGRIQIALALHTLGHYVVTGSRSSNDRNGEVIHTTPEGRDVGDFIRRCARKLGMTAVQLATYFVGQPDRLAEMRAMWNLDAKRDDLRAFIDATPGGKMLAELKAQGL
jgi:hypothetical protein